MLDDRNSKRGGSEEPVRISQESAQQIVTELNGEIVRDRLGEKALKLLELKAAGFPVPDFFVVTGLEAGELEVNEAVISNYDKLGSSVIARSSHVAEGQGHPFSGIFQSFKNISQLVQDRPDFSLLSEDERRRAEFDFLYEDPIGLTEACRRVCESTTNYSVSRYLEERQITDFDPTAMNLIVMKQIDVEVFGMFVTSDALNPNQIHIHYSLSKKSSEIDDSSNFAAEAYRMLTYGNGFRGRMPGGIVTYDRESGKLLDSTLPHPEHQTTLEKFGALAAQVGDVYGIQQVELGFDGQDVYIFQSRTINLGDPADVPRFARYQTLPGEFNAIGSSFHTLPVLVIDQIENTQFRFRYTDDEYRKLLDNARGKETDSNEWKKLDEYFREKRAKYIEYLHGKKNEFGSYILVIKDAEDLMAASFQRMGRDILEGKNYDLVNEFSRDAKVVIQGRTQNAIRHEDWDHVESGGIRIFPAENNDLMGCFFVDDSSEDFDCGDLYSVKTGEVMSVLSNIDGVFIWPARWEE